MEKRNTCNSIYIQIITLKQSSHLRIILVKKAQKMRKGQHVIILITDNPITNEQNIDSISAHCITKGKRKP